jgi:hypothetical protein
MHALTQLRQGGKVSTRGGYNIGYCKQKVYIQVSYSETGLLLTSLTDASRADFLIFPLYPEDGGDTFLRNVG